MEATELRPRKPTQNQRPNSLSPTGCRIPRSISAASESDMYVVDNAKRAARVPPTQKSGQHMSDVCEAMRRTCRPGSTVILFAVCDGCFRFYFSSHYLPRSPINNRASVFTRCV